MIFLIISPESVGAGQLISSFFPVVFYKYWYFTAYFALFFMMPAINFLVEKWDKRSLTFLVVSLVIVFSVMGTVFLTKYFEGDVFAINEGYSPFWIGILYFIGAYIKKYNLGATINKNRFLVLYFICIAFTWGFRLIVKKLSLSFYDLFISYSSPTILLAGIALLIWFANFRPCRSLCRVIAFFAPATFGVYLIHLQHNISELVFGNIKHLAINNGILLFFVVLGIAIALWIICSLIDKLRIKLFQLLRVSLLSIKIEKLSMKIAFYTLRKINKLSN